MLRADDVASGLIGAVIKDPVHDAVVLKEYLETVVKERDGDAESVSRVSQGAVSRYRVFGVRHHGPGSAHSLRLALDEMQPDCVLIEGPPDADGVIQWVADERMTPPVALLTYVKGDPGRAAYFPFAEYSPEWQALRHAVGRGIPVRFMDLPMKHQFAFVGRPRRRRKYSDPLGLFGERRRLRGW